MLPLILMFLIACVSASTVAPVKSYVPQIHDRTCFTNNQPDPTAIQQLEPVYISKDFSAAERTQIVDAIGEMNYVFNGYKKLYVVNDKADINDELIDKVQKSGVGLVIQQVSYSSPELEGNGILGYCNELNGNFISLVQERADSYGFYTIILHEINHCAGGMPHIAIKGSLMYPFCEWQTAHFDPIAARELISVNSWMKLEHINWCEE